MQESLEKLFNELAMYLPRVAGALALLIGGWILAWLLSRLLRKGLEATKIDLAAERLNDIDIIQRAQIQIKPSSLLSRFIFYLLLLFVILATADTLGLKGTSEQIQNITSYAPKLLSALGIFILGIVLANFLRNVVFTTCRSLNIPSGKIISGFVFYFMFVTVSITALEQSGVDTSFLTNNLIILLTGVVLAFAIGYGLASRDTLQNILAANYNRKRFAIGDLIEIDALKGEIVEMDNSGITVQIDDNRQVVIPQSDFAQKRVFRFMGEDERQFFEESVPD